jgi:hypothetical protein
VTGLVRGCAGSDDGGGVLAALLLPLVMDLASGVGDGPVRTAVGFLSPRSGVSFAFANCVCPARTAVVLTPPLLAYGCCGWVCLRVCRQRQQWWSSRRLALCFLLGLFLSSPSGRCRRVVVVILVIGTLFSSWRALAGAGYLLRGWGGQWLWLAGGYHFLSLSFCGWWWWLVVIAIVTAIVVLRGEGGVVVWWEEMVEFRMLVEFKLREFSHMTSLMHSKRRQFFTNLHIESLILLISSREFPGV